jgi:hypothetical protein
MSLILQGSTSGSITLQEPAVAGTTVLTLPAVSGNVLTDTSPKAGNVIQVVNTIKTDTFSTTSTSFTDVTGLSASITPTSSSSRIMVCVSFYMSSNSSSGYPLARVLRDSTAIYIGDAAGSRSRALTNTGGGLFSTDGNTGFNISAQFLDSPATTSATTYKIQLMQSAGNTAYINRVGTDSDSAGIARTASSIVLMEIAA